MPEAPLGHGIGKRSAVLPLPPVIVGQFPLENSDVVTLEEPEIEIPIANYVESLIKRSDAAKSSPAKNKRYGRERILKGGPKKADTGTGQILLSAVFFHLPERNDFLQRSSPCE